MVPAFERAGVAELADAPDSKSGAVKTAWGFNSPLQHQLPRALFLPVESAAVVTPPSSPRGTGESLPQIAPPALLRLEMMEKEAGETPALQLFYFPTEPWAEAVIRFPADSDPPPAGSSR